jgi:hypothetical protein
MSNLMDKRAPGRRLIKRLSLRTKYWLVGGFSAVLIGSGLAVLNEASMLKHTGASTTQWFLMGLYGYLLAIGGLGILQISTRMRVKLDVRKEIRREIKRSRKGNSQPSRREFPKKENPFG